MIAIVLSALVRIASRASKHRVMLAIAAAACRWRLAMHRVLMGSATAGIACSLAMGGLAG